MGTSHRNDYGTMTSDSQNQIMNPSRGRRRRNSHAQDQDTEISRSMSQIPRKNDTFLVGVSLLMLVVLLWTSSNFLTNYQLTQGYDKPFAVTYLNTSSFALYLIPFALILHQRSQQRRVGHSTDFDQKGGVWARVGFVLPSGSIWSSDQNVMSSSYAPVRTTVDEEEAISEARSARHNVIDIEHRRLMRPSSIDGRRPLSQRLPKAEVSQVESQPLDLHQTAKLALQFMIVWFLANYCLNLALKLTSVASATTLSSASGFFTLALGALVGVELFSFAKLGAVTMSFIGVLMVMRADVMGKGDSNGPGDGNPSNEFALPFAGDLLSLASALFYAVYVTLLKHKIGREERVSMPLFFGFVGIFNIALMWPIGLLLHFTKLETIELPHGKIMWAGVLVNMAITVISDFAYLLAMLKSSPLVATVGLSLTIPLAILGDILRGAHSGGSQADIGSIIVISSFVIVGLVDRKLAKQQQGQ